MRALNLYRSKFIIECSVRYFCHLLSSYVRLSLCNIAYRLFFLNTFELDRSALATALRDAYSFIIYYEISLGCKSTLFKIRLAKFMKYILLNYNLKSQFLSGFALIFHSFDITMPS